MRMKTMGIADAQPILQLVFQSSETRGCSCRKGDKNVKNRGVKNNGVVYLAAAMAGKNRIVTADGVAELGILITQIAMKIKRLTLICAAGFFSQ
jgi:hypothetical protein